MKNVIKFLPVMAILLGSGLAVATTSKTNAPNVYKHPVTGQWEDLSPYPPGSYTCPGTGECTGYRDENGIISQVTEGVFTPNPA